MERTTKFNRTKQIMLEVQRQQGEVHRQHGTSGNTVYISHHLVDQVTSEAKSHFRNNVSPEGIETFMGLKVIRVEEKNHITVAQVEPFVLQESP